MSRINFPGTFLQRQIRMSSGLYFRTSPGCQIKTSPKQQIGMSPGWSSRIFRGRWKGVSLGHLADQYLPAGKYVVLSNFSIYYTWKNFKKSNNINKFEIAAPTWNEEFEVLDGSYSASDI